MIPQLDLALIDTHSLGSICVMDISSYPVDWNSVSPTIQITPPGYETVSLVFTPSSLQVYKSSNLGIVCDWCDQVDLPDGIWNFKYSLYPAITYFVEKSIVKVDRLQAKFDEAYIMLDITQCDNQIKKIDKEFLSITQDYIDGAIAAGNKCVNKLFDTFYKKAAERINTFINNKSCVTH